VSVARRLAAPALLALLLLSAQPAQASLPVAISFETGRAGRPVPARFLGLSFEVGALAQLGGYARRGDLVSMLRSLGPGVLRFGGVTADQNVAWTDSQTPRPAWATSTIGPAQMSALGLLARRSGWQVLLTVGMAHFEPQAAAREVAAAKQALGPHLAAVELGNEPDAYGKHGFRALPWLVQGYEEEVSDYREAIAALTPGIAVAGPDVSGSGVFTYWGYAEALTQMPILLTGHHYPLGCAQQPPPTIELLLSAATRGREAQSLSTYLTVASALQLPLRIDETNSVSCGGVPGISNTFASALWAAGYIAQAMAAGTVGINLHGNPNNCSGYTPFCAPDPSAAERGELRARPDWYALLLTRSLVGYRPVPTPVSTAGQPDLAATGFTGRHGAIKLLLSDDDPPDATSLSVHVSVGAGMGTGTIERLTGPAPAAETGVRLTGKTVANNGGWIPGRLQRAPAVGGIVTVAMQPSSAAVLTVERAVAHKPRRPHKH